MASVSQSRTEWVKKGDTVNGKVVTKGYLAQKGKPEKRVTAKVKLVTETGGKRAGQTQKYSAGRKVADKRPAFGGGGSNPAVRPQGTSASTGSKKPDVKPGAGTKPGAKTVSYQTGSAGTSGAVSRSATQAAAFAKANKAKKSGPDYRSIAAANRKDSASAMNRQNAKPSKPKATVSESIPDIRNLPGYLTSTRLMTAQQRQKSRLAAQRRAAANAKVLAALKAKKGKN